MIVSLKLNGTPQYHLPACPGIFTGSYGAGRFPQTRLPCEAQAGRQVRRGGQGHGRAGRHG